MAEPQFPPSEGESAPRPSQDPRILGPIPTPPAQRWREVRLIYLPRTVFGLGVMVAAWLWSQTVTPATIVAEADTQKADVRSAHAGVITNLSVELFETVRAGQIVGQVAPDSAGLPEKGVVPAVKLGEAAAKPPAVPLIAPIDGVVSLVGRHSGERVAEGDTVLSIVSKRASRLTGYLRQPLPFEPTVGMTAEIRTRGLVRETAVSKVTGVGVAMEAIPASLLGAMHLPSNVGAEHALRVYVAIPKGLRLWPGEHVDVTIH